MRTDVSRFFFLVCGRLLQQGALFEKRLQLATAKTAEEKRDDSGWSD